MIANKPQKSNLFVRLGAAAASVRRFRLVFIAALLSLLLAGCAGGEASLLVDQTEIGIGGSDPLVIEAIRLFDESAARLGSEVTGAELVNLTADSSGNPLRIYENLVWWVDRSQPGVLQWLYLPELVSIAAEPAVPSNGDGRYYYWELQNGLGHNVYYPFWTYISLHSGPEMSGPPITEVFRPELSPGVLRQCFLHLCLDYHEADDRIAPAPLGILYQQTYLVSASPAPISAPVELRISLWEADYSLEPGESKTFCISISQDNLPASGWAPSFEITLPTGTQIYQMPPSGGDGVSCLQLPSIDMGEAGNGQIIPFKVCLNANNTGYCVENSYIYWAEPPQP